MPRVKKQHLKRQKDGYFYCKYHGKIFKGQTEDEAFAKRTEYKRGERIGEIVRDNPTVSEYADHWFPIAKAGVRERTKHACKIHLSHLKDCIGDLLVKDVRPSDIKSVYSKCYLDVSDGYIKHARSVFLSVFKSAVEDGLIRTNPVASDTAKPHSGKTGSHRSITPEERALIETVAVDNPMHVAAIIMLYAGLRPQEVKALRMEDIDVEAGVIHVRNFVHKVSANEYEESATGKNKKATREVPLFPPVIEATKGKKGLILSNNGGVATVAMWRKAWETYCRQMERHLNGVQKRWYGRTKEQKSLVEAGESLPPWKPFSVTPYDLRHSFVSWCRDCGVELHTVVEWMGHTDATMILRIYDEVSSTRSKTEAEKLLKTAFGLRNGLPEQNQSP